MNNDLARIIAALRPAEHILCVSHVAPDGDAVGSLLGMGWILRGLGKQPVLALQDPTPDKLTWLPGADAIAGPDRVGDVYDLVICLDASSPDRMGSVYRPAHQAVPLLVIDHHITNTYFGAVNWVEPGCAATCEMLVILADALGLPLTGPLADVLLTGIVTDTLAFRTSNTTPAVLNAAMRLMAGGADLTATIARTLNRLPFAVLKLWGETLANARLEGGVIWTTVSRAQVARAGAPENEDGHLSSQLILAQEADISATFTEVRDGTGQPAVECSFRAKPGFDVATVAFDLGGGGHPAASGCTLPGTLDVVPEAVVQRLKAARAAGRAAANGA